MYSEKERQTLGNYYAKINWDHRTYLRNGKYIGIYLNRVVYKEGNVIVRIGIDNSVYNKQGKYLGHAINMAKFG